MGKVDCHQKDCGYKQYLKKEQVPVFFRIKLQPKKKMLNDFALMFQNKPAFHTLKAKVLSDGGFGCSLISVFLVTNKLCDCLVFNDFHSKKDITFRQINVQNMIKRKKGVLQWTVNVWGTSQCPLQ